MKKADLAKMLSDKYMLIKVEEYLEITGNGKRRGLYSDQHVGKLEAEADMLAQENVALLEENHRLARELSSVRGRLGQGDADTYRRFIVWLATVGRTGNFAWKDARPLLKEGKVSEAMALVEARMGVCFSGSDNGEGYEDQVGSRAA